MSTLVESTFKMDKNTAVSVKLPDHNVARSFDKVLETEKAYGFVADKEVFWLPKAAVSFKGRIEHELGTMLCFNVKRWFKMTPDKKLAFIA